MSMPVVASRFSMLPDDDEDLNKKKLRNKVLNKNGPEKSSPEHDAKTKKNKNKKKKKKIDNDKEQLQALAFGKKVVTATRSQDSPSLEVNDEQLASWISHDQVINDETFAKDLQDAILASKIEMMREEKCKENDNKKSSKKPVAMSLQAFNNMDLNGATPNESPECDMNEKFYADVDEATKIAMNREQIRESLEQRYSNLPDQALLKQYKSILQSKDDEIIKVMEQNELMKNELDKIKKRYKQFRELLDQVESRNKAEVISENMKLKKLQDEISNELSSLREENEKLKTKLAEKDKDLLKLKDRRKNSESR